MNAVDNMSEVKRINRKAVFDCLLRRVKCARTDVAREVGLSMPTLIKITDFLVSKGLIVEEKMETSMQAGRPPQLFRINQTGCMAIGIFFDGTVCDCALVDFYGQLHEVERIDRHESLEKFVKEDLFDVIRRMREKCEKRHVKPMCVGLALPAVVDQASMKVLYAPYLDIYKPVDFSGIAERIYRDQGLKMIVENEVNAAAIGECLVRADQQLKDFVYVALSDGVGAGIILDGELHRGVHFMAGEIGYLNQDIHAVGSWDKQGALESKLDSASMEKRWPGLETEQLDQYRDQAVAYLADYISSTMTNMQCILDVDCFVLGGKRAAWYGDPLIDAINERMRIQGLSYAQCQRVRSAHPELVGAAWLAIDAYLKQLFIE